MRVARLMYGVCLGFMALSVTCVAATKVPSVLPDPDDTPPAAGKPVKVYLLAGQSNMVGFGTLKGSSPYYSSIFLSADPSVLPAKLPFGSTALLPHGVYQSADQDSPKGAKVAVYAGAYDAAADYASMKAVQESTVALGTVTEELPSVDAPHTVIARAYLDVPISGNYKVYAGYGESTHAIVILDGKEVYRKELGQDAVQETVSLEQGKRYPVMITYLKGGSAAFWMEQIDMKGMGDLVTLTKEGRFPWFVDDEGNWTKRNDVTYWDVRLSKDELGSGGPLNPLSNAGGKFMGPEVAFGYVMGTFHDEPVLLIESSIGNRSLNWDYRPPSSGRTDPESEYEGYEYRALVEGARKVLDNLDKIVPNYQGQGYEVAGFAWWQGHKDSGSSKEDYEKNLVNLIKDLRKEFNVPEMKVAIATVGFHGYELPESWQGVFDAQMAVGDTKQHPEFAGNVKTVDGRAFWRAEQQSPSAVDFHYNKNAETYALTGEALGRAMVEMMGGDVEPIMAAGNEKFTDPNAALIYSKVMVSYSDGPVNNPKKDQFEAMYPALRPIVLGKLIPAFLDRAMGEEGKKMPGLKLKEIVKGKTQENRNPNIDSQLDTLVGYYESVGIKDYSWREFAPEIKTSEWFYYSFDPPEKLEVGKPDRYRKVTLPEGMENWYAVDFDPTAAGWEKGLAPFGQNDGKLEPKSKAFYELPWGATGAHSSIRQDHCIMPLCACHVVPKTLWKKEVILLRQTFDVPPLKDGYAYRIVLGGAGCDRTGEGFAIYINGKLLEEQKKGFYRESGVRGAYLTKEIMSEFANGTVTIAVTSFLRSTHFRNLVVPPNGMISVSMQEMKLPPINVTEVSE